MTTSTIGMLTRNDKTCGTQAFTLIELILVMALLATFLALSAPSLKRSFRQRGLEQEATQLLAATEYARDEAVSQGVPMSVWIDPASGSFGVQAVDGFAGDASREKMWFLNKDIHFDSVAADMDQGGHSVVAQFDPEGDLDPESVSSLRIANASDAGVILSQTEDGWGYEIVKEAQ